MKFRTRAIHVGNAPDPQTGAVVQPIHPATTFVQPGAGEWGAFDYSRSGNPTRSAVQETLASLEGGCGALAFASGMAATHCATMLLSAGDHLLAGMDIYGGSYRLFHKICKASNIEVTLVDLQDPQAISREVRPNTKMLWLESIGNPCMSIPDLPTITQIAHQHQLLVGVDNTFATPVLLRPLELGVDIVMHSGTKYLGGHSDCLAGVLAVQSPELLQRLYYIQNATGAVLSPFESFLLARGIKTLDLRVRESSRSALQIAEYLEKHPMVRSVLYPGLPSHPDHLRAQQLLDGGFGGMITFEAIGDFETTKQIVKSTQLFHLAVSLGAAESLIEQPASMSHASYDAAARQQAGITDGLIRISVGLEDPQDLIEDLDQALRSS
ncbi:trans-sulfuration enzyme family protein [Aureliella helgolandensis]|uniref:Cystathionine beta-lyase n=1 Tax=Aureliella helgolandensis TaxID=2527968 RepID=A0A518FZZ9_9BACT|nr:PLP-dependent aspartate aminotransferase family protein [Aureliella helgolandensis]QDV21929.1 Cystathionine beta-lyase [Aureliella helgolandensis]